MKYLILIALFFITSCTISNQIVSNKTSNNSLLNHEMKNSIIDGFFNGDTINIPKNTYYLN